VVHAFCFVLPFNFLGRVYLAFATMADDEKVRKLLQALLVVPEGELDDTHFDKLQSRLMRCCEPAFLPAFLRLGVLDTIQV